MTAESRVARDLAARESSTSSSAHALPRERVKPWLKIAATAVCHTDLDMYTGANKSVRYPVVLGHESTGTVEAVTTEGSGLTPGQTVLINPVITCGHCDSCQRGLEHLCRNAGLFGREIEGSLSEDVTL